MQNLLTNYRSGATNITTAVGDVMLIVKNKPQLYHLQNKSFSYKDGFVVRTNGYRILNINGESQTFDHASLVPVARRVRDTRWKVCLAAEKTNYGKAVLTEHYLLAFDHEDREIFEYKIENNPIWNPTHFLPHLDDPTDQVVAFVPYPVLSFNNHVISTKAPKIVLPTWTPCSRSDNKILFVNNNKEVLVLNNKLEQLQVFQLNHNAVTACPSTDETILACIGRRQTTFFDL